jgi:hypothetical protein
MPNRYLDGLPARGKRRGPWVRLVVLWGLLVLVFLAIWQLLQPSDGSPAVQPPEPPSSDPSWTFVLGSTVVALAIVAAGVGLFLRRRAGGLAAMRSADAMLAREQVDAPVATLRSILPKVQPGHAHFSAMLVLGRCAEMHADFTEAAEIFELATSSLGGPALRLLRRQLVPLAAAYRAFALAAAGRLDEADAALAATNEPLALPPTRALVTRARALVLAKRGEHRALLDLLAKERAMVRNGLNERNRSLLRLLAARARVALEGGTLDAVSRADVDPALLPWIDRVGGQA